jgi:GNAT superfamily N-acetyltransferase
LTEAVKPRIEKLRTDHALTGFDRGSQALNTFLERYALANQKAGSSQTYVALIAERIVGYYTLTVGDVAYGDAPERLGKGLARHPIPVMIVARLAIAQGAQGQVLGPGLLRDAMRRTLQVADIAGIRALLVHAKDENAKAFYEHFGFSPFADEPRTLFRLLKDIRHMVASVSDDGAKT